MPNSLIESCIIPLVKNRCGDLTDQNNYRPVALANILSKVFELVLLSRLEKFLWSTDNQFGFKAGHSTEMCVYLLQEFIDFCRRHNIATFVTFLDASKAFDRVNYWKLFQKHIDRNTPLYIVKIMSFWYKTQTMCVQWGNSISSKFSVGNGVKQGGILSPKLFNVYVNDLSVKLS